MTEGYKFIVKKETILGEAYVPKGAVGVVATVGDLNKVTFNPSYVANCRSQIEEWLSDSDINDIDASL